MKKRLLILGFALFTTIHVKAQENESSYGMVKNMPVFYLNIKENLTWPMAWENSSFKDFTQWKQRAREVLDSCLKPVPSAPKEFAPQIIAREKRNGYEAQKIMFNISEWSRIPAYLLIPEGKGPFPAIVMLHDHGAHFSIGKEKMVQPIGTGEKEYVDSRKWVEQCYDGVWVGDYYAQNGYVVLAIDALFWNERGRKEGVDYNGQQALASNLMQMGMNWCGIITYDDIRSVDFLASLPFVNRKEIGALGFSMGAHRAWMLAAATDKVKAATAVCWMNTTESLMTLTNNQNKGGSAYSMLVPGIRNYMDYPHVASIACPKPMFFINGAKDKLFPVEGVKDAYRIMRQVWDSRQAGDKLKTKLWDDSPHFFNKEMQKESLEFFDKYLKQVKR